jgi:hypothetical protein
MHRPSKEAFQNTKFIGSNAYVAGGHKYPGAFPGKHPSRFGDLKNACVDSDTQILDQAPDL